MKRILSLVLVLALIATLGLSSAFAEEGFADGKFTEPHHITVEIFERPNDGNSDVTSNPFAEYIKQGMLETANVNVTEELVNLIQAQRVYEMNSKVLSAVNDMLSSLNSNT